MKTSLLPKNLVQQLQRFERRLWWLESALAVAIGGVGLLGAGMLLFAFDRVWNTPPLLRLLLLASAIASIVLAVGWWGRHWLFRRRAAADLALIVQRRHRQLGDKLQGIIELADGGHPAPGMSPALCRAAIAQVADECSQIDFRTAADARRPRRAGLALLLLGGITIALGALFPEAVSSAWARLLAPLAPVERYTFTQLAPLPPGRVVLHGEPFTVSVALAPTSRFRPDAVTFTLANGATVQAPVVDGVATAELPGITVAMGLNVRAGDDRQQMQVTPVHRPALTHLTATVYLPDYLRRDPQAMEVSGQHLRVPVGSRIAFTGATTSPLRAATLATASAAAVPLTVDGAGFVSEPIAVADEMRLLIDWQDAHGFGPVRGREVTIETVADRPPTVVCPELSRDHAILVTESLNIEVRAEDDFAVQSLAVRWQIYPRDSDRPSGELTEDVLQPGSPAATTLTDSFVLAPTMMGIPAGSIVRLRAVASDYRPHAEPVFSEEHRIYILSETEYAELIQQRLERLQAALEEVTRSEEDLLAGKEGMLERGEEYLRSEDAAQRLREQEFDEAANASDLQAIQREGTELLTEAMRNPEFSPEALSEWSEMLAELQPVSEQQMPQLLQTMQQAQKSPSQRPEKVEQARQQQQAIVDKLRKMAEKMNDTLDSMIARNFATRLRELATAERQTGTALQAKMGELLGVLAADLEGPLAAFVTAQATAQDGIRVELGAIFTELQAFVMRTSFAKYAGVLEAMREAKVPDAILAVGKLIRENQTSLAHQATGEWAARFEAWADALDPPKDGEGEGESGEGGEMDMETILKLLRLLQEEHQIREITRMLDRRQQEMADYAERTLQLSDRQLAALQDLDALERAIAKAQLSGYFLKIQEAMTDASNYLFARDTGADPQEAESAAIVMLAELISSASQQMSSSAAMAGAMMKAMGAGAGGGQGGNPSPYESNAANTEVTGPAAGTRDSRDADRRHSGRWSQQIPAEFRDALEGYYRGVDQLQEPR